MRSLQRDQNRTITFTDHWSDAPSGSGVANGVPYTWTRTGTGTYQFQFDTRITPVAVIATGDAINTNSATAFQMAAGTFKVVTLVANAVANGHGHWSCTAIDRRT